MPWDASACVLPHVERKQTEEIIQKIMDRFPDTGKLASRPSTAEGLFRRAIFRLARSIADAKARTTLLNLMDCG
jgi:hypothetical protein